MSDEPDFELLPCPFCGSGDIILQEGFTPGYGWTAKCESCSAALQDENDGVAIDKWNTRTGETQ